jgi:hypothetical protein
MLLVRQYAAALPYLTPGAQFSHSHTIHKKFGFYNKERKMAVLNVSKAKENLDAVLDEVQNTLLKIAQLK